VFHDRARIRVRAGRGGDGGLSFRREKYVPRGGPDGGDGGRGGNVVLLADPDLRDLSGFRSRHEVKAGRGEAGRGSGKHGADGETMTLRVPVGTQVFDSDGHLIADLAYVGASAVAASGGVGGRGNRRFVSATRQVPRFAETGLPGDEVELDLRLKLLVDAALVGLPNAGKSSLLTRISNARPKVADYPFTTLEPVLGTVESPDGKQLVVADVPGLIEGAADGAGLGHEFLAHLERARLLIHVVDAAAGGLREHYATIRGELESYGAGLDELPEIVVLNKLDLVGEPSSFQPEGVLGIFHVSCATGAGIDAFRRQLFALVPTPVEEESEERELADFLVYRPKPRRRPFRILRTDRGFRITGTPPGREELEAALRDAGARPGVEVVVGDEILEYQ
jgi:GTP-binding protein